MINLQISLSTIDNPHRVVLVVFCGLSLLQIISSGKKVLVSHDESGSTKRTSIAITIIWVKLTCFFWLI